MASMFAPEYSAITKRIKERRNNPKLKQLEKESALRREVAKQKIDNKLNRMHAERIMRWNHYYANKTQEEQ